MGRDGRRHCLHLAAAGHTARTIEARRKALGRIGRGLRCPPVDIIGAQLVEWFGGQSHWKPETRRFYRSAACGFFARAYKTQRVATYLPDHLRSVRIPPAAARPVPDDAWRQAISAADARVAFMMRLAAEAGLRRAEVAQVHTRDVPISDALGAAIRR